MDKRKPGRPRAEYPYVCGPYGHGSRQRLVIVTGRTGRGRREGYSRTFEDLAAARTWKREFERQVAGSGKTLADAMNKYLDHAKRKGNKASTITTLRHQLESILDGSLPLVDLNKRRAQDMYDALVNKTTRGGGPIKAATHRGTLARCRSFGEFCVAQGWIRSNPFAAIEGVGRRNRGKPQLTFDETARFEAHCLAVWRDTGDRQAVAALLALMFSMRATEVSQLTARDVDAGGKILRIAETEAKTESSKRMAEVPAAYQPILLELARNPALPDGHLFSLSRGKKRGKPADRAWVLRAVKRLTKAAVGRSVTAHGLRGTSATIGAAHAGAQVMSTALGHTSVGMTKSAYIQAGSVADSQAQKLAKMLADSDEESMSDVGTKLDE